MDQAAAEVGHEIDRVLIDIHTHVSRNTEGTIADYIPEIASVDPEPFGLAITTAAGTLHEIGDTETTFTIQSVSKAVTYCIALETAGRATVLERVGVEPSGDPFNAIELDPASRRPYNPMVNAGAITVAGILRDVYGADEAFQVVLDRLSEAAGRPLEMDEAVYRSEAATGHRNRAIGHLLVSAGALREPMEPALDLYFRQCSIRVTARDLSRIGATVANMGEHPVSGRQVFDVGPVRDTLAVMFSCGMYDYSGNWAYDVGVPAKSGVGGGIMGVVNRQLGVGTYSPRLDRNGNSVRGVEAFRRLSAELGLHAFDMTNPGSALIGSFFTGSGRT
ncbi:glutaminase A [Mongoliimonas terrestris]|uniref:glutaminase A n=1 Tax=Mongoliimonas terrestris TaxID=1709001 RepID=UPI0009497DDA|nr:glutaminase A [Mongoliimonas terrestris]